MWSDLGPPLTSEEMEVVEANAISLGVPVDALMERAGRAIAEETVRHLPAAPAKVAVVCGSGNNGGDGTCAAYYLREWGHHPEVWLVRPPARITSHSARRCYDRIQGRLPVHVVVPKAEELAGFPLLVDGLLGTGQAGSLRDPYREAVRAMTASRVPVLSIDLPTGTRDPEGVRPAWTVALTAPKAEMDPATAGEVLVRDIGIPPTAWAETGPGEFLFFPSARLEREGRRARVVVVGGGPYAGAPAIAGLAALRSGAERATVVAPAGAAALVQGFSPNLVVQPIGEGRFRPDDVSAILRFVEGAHPRAIVLGMGAGAATETVEAMSSLVRAWAGRVPLVVDADALRGLEAGLPSPLGPAPCVVTPNPGEYVRDFGGPAGADRPEHRQHVTAAARRLGVTIVAKGAPDVISDGRRTAENLHHSPYQTVAGAGDTLGGVLGHLLGEGLAGLHAGRLATYWVGDAGARAAGPRGAGILATDLIDQLPATLVAGATRVRHAE